MKQSITHLPDFPLPILTSFVASSGLSDLALTQILFVVGLPWVGVAAKQGPSHVVFWLIAMALFYVPPPSSSSTSIA